MFKWFRKKNSYSLDHKLKCYCSSFPISSSSAKPSCTCFSAQNPHPSEPQSKTTLTCNRSPSEDDVAGSPRTRKVGPPPLKPGVDYINPGGEDQMVSNVILILF